MAKRSTSMSETMSDSLLPAVVVEPPGRHSASVIWLHGLGADGHDFEALVPELGLAADHGIRFIFPHAPMRPITINNGYVMRGWYDIRNLESIDKDEDCDGIRESEQQVERWISEERAQGITSERIVLAGFSQGGVIALQSALRHKEPLAGVMALSTYLGCAETLADERHPANASIPVLMAHGLHDDILPIHLGQQSRDKLLNAGYRVEWYEYPMPHSVHPDEVSTISRWLTERLG